MFTFSQSSMTRCFNLHVAGLSFSKHLPVIKWQKVISNFSKSLQYWNSLWIGESVICVQYDTISSFSLKQRLINRPRLKLDTLIWLMFRLTKFGHSSIILLVKKIGNFHQAIKFFYVIFTNGKDWTPKLRAFCDMSRYLNLTRNNINLRQTKKLIKNKPRYFMLLPKFLFKIDLRALSLNTFHQNNTARI